MSIESTLEERGNRYGSFEEHAKIAQTLQDVMRAESGWHALEPDQKQALTVIADKIARMLNGDPAYRDNWHDIVGYAKLVDDRMLRDESSARVKAADEYHAEKSSTLCPEFYEWCASGADEYDTLEMHMRTGEPIVIPRKGGYKWAVIKRNANVLTLRKIIYANRPE